MNLSCSSRMIKYLMFAFNLFFVLSGIIIIAVGATVKTVYTEYADFLNSKYFSLPNMLIATGALIFIISFFGCCGAIRESWIMLGIFSILLCIIFIFEFSAGIAGYVLKGKTIAYLDDTLKKNLHTYKSSHKLWDTIQSEFQCCGVDSYEDWKGIVSNDPYELPMSCCPAESGTVGVFYCNTYKTTTTVVTSASDSSPSPNPTSASTEGTTTPKTSSSPSTPTTTSKSTTPTATPTTTPTTIPTTTPTPTPTPTPTTNSTITPNTTTATASTTAKTTSSPVPTTEAPTPSSTTETTTTTNTTKNPGLNGEPEAQGRRRRALNESSPITDAEPTTTTTPAPSPNAQSTSTPYQTGCKQKFGAYIKKHAVQIGGCAIGLAIVQVLGIAFSCHLVRQLKNGYYST